MKNTSSIAQTFVALFLRVFLLVLGVQLAGSAARAVSVSNFVARTYTNGMGGSMPYRLFIPSSYVITSNYPVVLFLHGAGECGTDNSLQLTGETDQNIFAEATNQAKYPAFMVAPQIPIGSDWTNTSVRNLVLGLMSALKGEFTIDTNRCYLTGLSMGSIATWDYLIKNPGLYAAGISAAGAFQGTFTNIAKAPVWQFQGAFDGVISPNYAKNAVNTARRLGSKALYTEYTLTATHNVWPGAYNNRLLLGWMYAQRLGIEPTNAPALRILSPTNQPLYFHSGSTLDLSGTATDGTNGISTNGITSVVWTNFQNNVVAASGVASGTTNWSITNIPINTSVTNVIVVIARGSSLNVGWGGNTFFSDTLFVQAPPASPYLSLTTSVAGVGGVIAQSPAPIAAPNLYATNTPITLVALPMLGYSFAGWSNSVSGSSHLISFSITSNMNAVARFDLLTPDVIVDNTNASFAGSWTTGSNLTGVFGPDFAFIPVAGNGGSAATFRPSLPFAGNWKVSTRYPVSTQAGIARYTVSFNGGATTNTVNQAQSAGTWVDLTTQPFMIGTNSFAQIEVIPAQTGSTNIIADAVKWSWASTQEIPPLLQSFVVDESGATLAWFALSNRTYAIQYTTNILNGPWFNVPGDVSTNGIVAVKTDSTATGDSHRFYRILLLP